MHDPYDLFCERDALDAELEQQEPQHTPPPWYATGTYHSPPPHGFYCSPVEVEQGASHIAGSGNIVAYAYGKTPEEAIANAALIVRAVNAHEELVGALRGLVRALRSMPPPASQALGLITIIEAMQEAQATLALVEEEA